MFGVEFSARGLSADLIRNRHAECVPHTNTHTRSDSLRLEGVN